MNKNSIVEAIKKLSQEMPGVDRVGPSATIPANSKNQSPEMPGVVRPPHVGASSATSQIAQMQRALIDLAQAVVPLDLTDPKANQSEQRFSGFLSDHMTTNQGVAFPKAKTQVVNQNVVIEAMRRIADQKGKQSEFKVDGNWGPLTNAALHNAFAIGVSTFNLAFTFKIHTDLTKESLMSFRDSIPRTAKDIDLANKLAEAPDLTKFIRHIQIEYNQVKEAVKNTRSYTNYVAQHPVHTYKSNAIGSGLTPEDKAKLSQAFDSNLQVNFTPNSGQPIQSLPITIKDLLTPESLTEWQSKNPAVKTLSLAQILGAITIPQAQKQEATAVIPTQPLPRKI